MSSGEVQQIYEMLQRIDELLSVIEGKTQSLEGSLPQAAEAAKADFYTIPNSEVDQAASEVLPQDAGGVSAAEVAPAEGVPPADAGDGGFTTVYSLHSLHRALSRLDSLFRVLEKTQGEQGKQILELAGKVTAAGSQIFMLKIMGDRFASALENKNYLGAALPVLGAVAGGIGTGTNAAAETQASMQLLKEGKIMFGRDVDRQNWAQEQWMIAMRHCFTVGLL